MAGDDAAPPRPTEDAVSLHTIAEPDVYSAQEQEQADADYALALALEEEEEQRERDVARSRAEAEERDRLIAQERAERQERHDEPYRDDLEEGNGAADISGDANDVPYRDDPDAEVEDERDPEHHAPTPSNVGKLRKCVGVSVRWTRDSARRATAWKSGVVKKALIAVLIALVGVAVLISLMRLIGPSYDSDAPLTRKQRAFEDSGSMNKYLVLPKLYPDLEDSASYECKRVWTTHTPALKCHEGVLTKAWDQGDGEHIRAANMDIYGYSRLVCDQVQTCSRAIKALQNNMQEACDERSDRFDWDAYRLRELRYFSNEDGADSGPMQLAQSLTARYDRLCDGPNTGFWGKPIEWDTYAGELWMRWGIADGKDAGRNLAYMETFLDATEEKRTIEAHVETGSVETEKETINYEVEVPSRRVGPGEGETDCGYSIQSWIERKWASFEYGAVIDPATGEPMTLADFNELMERAIKRCKKFDAGQMIRRRHEIWEQFGMWCNGGPCPKDKEPISKAVLQLIHGMNRADSPLPEIREMMNRTDAPTEALQALHDDLLDMPCGIWMTGVDLMHAIMPSDFLVRHLCSDACRNAIDRIQKRHGPLFLDVSQRLPSDNIVAQWATIHRRALTTCKGAGYSEMVTKSTPLCAPGYAFLGHPEWIFEESPDSKEVLAAFAPAVEKLAKSLPDYIRKPSPDKWTQQRLARQLSESVCNRCAARLLLRTTPDWMMGKAAPGGNIEVEKEAGENFAGNDDDTEREEHRKVVELYGTTCNKIVKGSAWSRE